MGVNSGYVCRDCGAVGPEVGDFGYIGYPSLEDRPEPVQGIHTFGYLYEGFKALRLLTGDLEGIRAFLGRHRRHRMALVFDDDPEAEGLQADSDDSGGDDGEPGRLDDGFYVLICSCGSVCRSTGAVRLRPFAPFQVTPKSAALFRERVVGAGHEDFYRLVDDILDPDRDPRRFDAFLREHQGHRVTAELETCDEWSLVPAGRERGEPSPDSFGLGMGEPSGVLPRLTLSPPLKFVWSFDEDPMPWAMPFDDCVLVQRDEPHTTFCLNLDGSVRWQLPGDCRWPVALGGDDQMALFASVEESPGTCVSRILLVDRQTGRISRDTTAPYSPVAILPEWPAFLGTRVARAGGREGIERIFLGLTSLGAEPSVVWEIDEAREEFGVVAIGRPCVSGRRVFVERGRRFVCLSLEDGREIWSADMAPLGGSAGDFIRGPAQVGDLVFVSAGHGLAALDAASGAVRWQRLGRSGWAVSRGEVHAWLVENSGDAPDLHWTVLEATSGRELARWSASERVYAACGLERSFVTSGPVIAESYIFFGDLAGRMWAVERDGGRPVWRERPRGIQSWPLTMPAVHGRRLYFGRVSGGGLPGRLYCYEEA